VFVAASFAGCLSNAVSFPKCEDKDNCLTIAFEAKEEYSNTEENPQEFADRLSEIIGMDVEIYPVTGAAGMIEALRFGHADIGFLDGGAAWLSWQTVGLEVMAAEQKADGRPYYNAIAWVHKDSDMAQADLDDDPETDPYALMAGKTSCHTSALGSSGMLLPMGFLITNEYIEVVGDPDEIDSLTDTVRNHFSEDSSIPNAGTKYHKYQGSLRCLAEHEGGTAMDYISFAKDPTVPDYCGEDPEDWCFEGGFTSTEDFHGINYTGRDNGEGFGRAPSHPVMYNPEYMTADQVTLLTDALALMSKSPSDGGSQSDLDILDAVFNTPGFTIINTEDHLGTYGTHIENVPGIQAYFADKYD
jgi:ABC-type phosphate/phosphonate transport system substrate-binding protein